MKFTNKGGPHYSLRAIPCSVQANFSHNNRSGCQHQNVRCIQTRQTAPTDMDQPSETAEFGAVSVPEAISQPRRLSIRKE